VTEIDALAPVEIVADGFKEPTGVAVDSSGAVFVSDRKAGEALRITGSEVVPFVTDLKRPVGLGFDAAGRLLIAEEGAGRLLRLESNGTLAVLAQEMKKPRWIAVAEDGVIYITAQGLKSAKDKDDEEDDEEQGEAILRRGAAGALTVWAEGFKGLEGILVHQGNVFAAARGLKKTDTSTSANEGGIFKIPVLTGGSAGEIARLTKDKIKKPFGLVVDALGTLYVSAEEIELEKKHKDAIGKAAPDGSTVSSPPNGTLTRFASKLEEPRGLAFDSSGNLYVADDNGDKKGRIIRFRAPPSPLLTVSPFTNQTPLTLTGTTEANSRIDAFVTDSANPTNSITLLTQDGSFNLTIPLTANAQNLLSVLTTAYSGNGLTSAPAEFAITHDNIAPLITNLQPANGSFLNNPRPLIRADFSDSLSGIDVGKVEIRLDGFDVTAQASVTSSGFTLNFLNCLNVLNCPLPEGPHTVSVTVFDHAGNTTSASSAFTVDITAPLIVNLTPAHGSVVTAARPIISADFSDTNSGVNPASARILLDGTERTEQAIITETNFTLDPFDLSPGEHTVFVSVSDRAGNSASAFSTFTVSLGPQLGRIGDRMVNLGDTLTFTVTATGTGAASVNLFVSPLPLSRNATFNAATGLFTFTPDRNQLGSFQVTFSATSGAQSVSETITITVQNVGDGITRLRGRVYNLNQPPDPLENVIVTLKSTGQSSRSGPDGFFLLESIPSGRQELTVNGREAKVAGQPETFAILAVPADLIEGVLNNLPSAITLPSVEVAAEVQVSAVFATVVSNPSVPGVDLTIPGGTAKSSDGTPFTEKLSINPVPDYGRPESRPEELRPGMAITIQPAGVRFNPPARLTFPNADGMVPGSELNLWSLSPDTGTFNLVGKGVVSQDGQSIVTTEGGVSASAWHFSLAASVTPADSSSGNHLCGGGCNPDVGSKADLEEGSLYLNHALPSYRSLGQSRSLSLTYSSVTADPRPIISLNATLSVRAAVPNTFSTKLEVGGVQQGGEVFVDTRSLPEDQDSTSRLSVQFDASNLPTNRYPYKATIFSNYQNSSIGGITNGNVVVLNRKASPFGSGWALTDIQQLHAQADGSVLLTTGDGTARLFSGGPDTFTSPQGDFSVLVRNPNGTYTRTLKEGTKTNFNAQGLETSTVDRNGNTKSYSYDASGRLLTISDPVGLTSSFTYSGQKLQKITDPAGKETLFQHDAKGNLIRITNPDGSFVSYAYDDKGHAIQATDERGNSTTYA
ncbi:MAG: hypothetical protein HYY46_17795, partial [Deltaproteobacteria bacterium]|nr:hypothetical protein [Deltaproteobacteria bacterium]